MKAAAVEKEWHSGRARLEYKLDNIFLPGWVNYQIVTTGCTDTGRSNSSVELKNCTVFSWLVLWLAFGNNPVLSIPMLPAPS